MITLSDENKKLPEFPNLTTISERLQKFDMNSMNIETINKIIPKYYLTFLSTSSESEEFQQNLKNLHKFDILEFLNNIEKDQSSFNRYNEVTFYCTMFFISTKYISQIMDMNISLNKEHEERLIRNITKFYPNFNHYIYLPYKHKLFQQTVQISKNEFLVKEASAYTDINSLYNDMFPKIFEIFEDPFKMCSFFQNVISFIHFQEFLILIQKSEWFDEKLQLSYFQLNMLVIYYLWKSILKTKHQVNFQYDEVINTFMKYSIANILEIILNNSQQTSEKDINSIISLLFALIFSEIEIDSKEVYIFAILTVLILYSKFFKSQNSTSNEIFLNHIMSNNNMKKSNQSIQFIQNILKKTNENLKIY
jgi:hypothetical protein